MVLSEAASASPWLNQVILYSVSSFLLILISVLYDHINGIKIKEFASLRVHRIEAGGDKLFLAPICVNPC
jgi:hypothetical protein